MRHRIQRRKAATAQLLSVTVGLRPLACCNCGFESLQGNGFLFLVSVVFCQVEVFVTGLLLVQRSSAECGLANWV